MKNAFIKLLTRLEKLLEIKSIITLSLLYIYYQLVRSGMIDVSAFSSVFNMIMGFYFGSQFEKSRKDL